MRAFWKAAHNSPQNIARVRQALEENPNISAVRNGLEIPSASFNEITRLYLNFYPYKMRIKHNLHQEDHARRLRYSEWLLQQFANENFIGKIVIGDEAAFAMNGRVSTQNVWQYAPKGQTPDFRFNVPNSREKGHSLGCYLR